MRPDTPADHIAEAERLLRTAERYPEDNEQLLLQAAAHFELADERARATTIYDRLLAAGPSNPYRVKALQAANLWEYGHEAEARALIDGIRAAAPREAAPWEIIAETLECHDELQAADECFTEGAHLLIHADEPITYAAHALLTGRHRVRRLAGTPHDEWDMVADTHHTGPIPLDELHDPKRVWALGSDNPAELRAEIARLRAELGERRAALSRPFPVAVLHWPTEELTELVTAYPSLTTEYPSHEAHLTQIETALRELAASGTPNLGIVTGSVPSYEAFAASEKTSPESTTLLAEYATTLAARGKATPWPPERSDVCWCGSGRIYKDCHGSPTHA
ncbi:SEC-C domain-containing protein [Streptomyces sp. A3M-1-3]|uniref:SEC-C domain-containing protein n=1 Tax=Streptomyces sp. A3M-1-3 TaxID=2962044 RepID=UPI0020B894D0|nr:SEC-C domain-containing protein [Streptomyces sp. A3M-1-3]MCP3819497.1 SEC-C domain-containing protein [Streptomyces sp. A3M-1-3]